MWVLHHIPKTAGSSVVNAWENAVPKERCANVFVDEEEMDGGVDYFRILDRKFDAFKARVLREEVEFACGHFTYDQIDWLISTGARIFVFLRHPVERLISDYKYQLSRPSLDPEGFARRYPSFEHYIRDRDVHNTMCRYISGVPDAERAGDKLRTGYVFAGTTERLSESNELLMMKAGILPGPLNRVNSSAEVSSRRMRSRANYEVILRLLNSMDMALYEQISSRQDDAIAALRQ